MMNSHGDSSRAAEANWKIIYEIIESSHSAKEIIERLKDYNQPEWILAEYLLRQRTFTKPNNQIAHAIVAELEEFDFCDDEAFISGMRTLFNVQKFVQCLQKTESMILAAKIFYLCRNRGWQYSEKLLSDVQQMYLGIDGVSPCPFAARWSRRTTKFEPLDKIWNVDGKDTRILRTDTSNPTSTLVNGRSLAIIQTGGQGDFDWSLEQVEIALFDGTLGKREISWLLQFKNQNVRIICTDSLKVPLTAELCPELSCLTGRIFLMPSDLKKLGLCCAMISADSAMRLLRIAPVMLCSLGVDEGWNGILQSLILSQEYCGPDHISLLLEEVLKNKGLDDKELAAHLISTFNI
jgi:hypothetical protein